MNAVEVFEDIKAVGERIASNDEQRFPEAASAGDFFRQGDIYITLHERVPEGAEPCSVALQLAPGTTKGSRHVGATIDCRCTRFLVRMRCLGLYFNARKR